MTEREHKKKLIEEGWTITHGKAYDQATHPSKTGIKIPILRHKGDIPKSTISSILRDAGLNNENIPDPSKHAEVVKLCESADQFVSMVAAETDEYRRQNDSRAIKNFFNPSMA